VPALAGLVEEASLTAYAGVTPRLDAVPSADGGVTAVVTAFAGYAPQREYAQRGELYQAPAEAMRSNRAPMAGRGGRLAGRRGALAGKLSDAVHAGSYGRTDCTCLTSSIRPACPTVRPGLRAAEASVTHACLPPPDAVTEILRSFYAGQTETARRSTACALLRRGPPPSARET
jgi:hypothetical protein